MNIPEFLKTVYVGDRALKSIVIDGWGDEVKLQVSCISRVRSSTWDYYTDEDLPDGFLVFEGVTGISFDPSGLIPNDLINDVRVEETAGNTALYLVVVCVDAVDATGCRKEIEIRIEATSMALEDAREPGRRIVK